MGFEPYIKIFRNHVACILDREWQSIHLARSFPAKGIRWISSLAFSTSSCRHRTNPQVPRCSWPCPVSLRATRCSLASCPLTDIVGKLCTCVAVCRGQRHWVASSTHNVPCKLAPSCSPRTRKRHSLWQVGHQRSRSF